MDRLRRIHGDVLSGSALLLLAATYFVAARELPEGRDEPGPAFFPLLLSIVLAILALALLIEGLRASRFERLHDLGRPLLAIGLSALYVAAFEKLGFILSTWLYSLAVTSMFRRDRRLLLLTVPTLSTVAIYLLFEIGLGLRFPRGPFE